MKQATKIWLNAGAFLVLAGFLLFAGVMTLNHWNWSALGSSKMDTRTVEIGDPFQKISISTDTDDILFAPSGNGSCSIVFLEREKVTHNAAVTDGTLAISVADTRNWLDHLVIFSTESPAMTVYLPQNTYDTLTIRESTGDISIPNDFTFGSISIDASTGDVECLSSASDTIRIHLDTGDIRMENLSAKDLDLKVSTGRMDLRNIFCTGNVKADFTTGKSEFYGVFCQSFLSVGDTGDISLTDVIAEGEMRIERTTGDVEFARCDASSLTVKTDTGDVEGTLLTDKVFLTKSDTGKIDVPGTTEGGRCEITTDTGDIKISVR